MMTQLKELYLILVAGMYNPANRPAVWKADSKTQMLNIHQDKKNKKKQLFYRHRMVKYQFYMSGSPKSDEIDKNNLQNTLCSVWNQPLSEQIKLHSNGNIPYQIMGPCKRWYACRQCATFFSSSSAIIILFLVSVWCMCHFLQLPVLSTLISGSCFENASKKVPNVLIFFEY